MKTLKILLICGLFMGLFVGCQCTPGTEKLGDLVDATNDHAIHLDGLYHAPWDVTRIGHPDWCKSKLNQLWCRCGCCKKNRPIIMGAEHQIVGEETVWQDAVPLVGPSEPPPLPVPEEY